MSLHRLPNGSNKPGTEHPCGTPFGTNKPTTEHVVTPPNVANWLAFIGIAVLIMAAFLAHPALGWCAVGFTLLYVAGGMKTQ